MSGTIPPAALPLRRTATVARLRTAALSFRRALGLERPAAAASAHDLVGRRVIDASWRRVGTLYDLVVQTETGRGIGAVVAHPGPLGVDVLSVVPWGALRFGTTSDRVVLLPHVAAASLPATDLGGRGDDRYRRFVAAAGAELGRRDRRPRAPAVVGVGLATVVLVLAPAALVAGVLALGVLLLGTTVGRLETTEPMDLANTATKPALATRSRVVDVEYEVVGGTVPMPWVPAESSGLVGEERRLHLLRVESGSPADGRPIAALDLEPVGGRVVGRWRGDCYVAEPAPSFRLAGDDLVAVVLWLDPAGDALAHLHRAGLRAV